MFKKAFFIVLSMALALCLIACGNKTNGSVGTTTQNGNQNTTTQNYELGDDSVVAPNFWSDFERYDQVKEMSNVDTKIQIYEGPEYSDKVFYEFEGVDVAVNGHDLYMYKTQVNHLRTSMAEPTTADSCFCYFDFEGEVTITVTLTNGELFNKAVVKPLGYGITPTISADKKSISFNINRQSAYVVEYNDNADNAIHIFANPMEENPITPDNIPENCIYFGPGVYQANAIPVKSGMTIYLAGGAFVYGNINANGMKDITVRGRGVFDGSIYGRYPNATVPINFMHCENVSVDGIIISNPAGWALNSLFVNGAHYNNVKIITARANGDGITMQSCHNMFVENCFVRGWDDNLVVKNYEHGTTENILFNNCILWTDLAQSTEVGYETYGATMKNIMFRNITVLHNYHKPVISCHNSDYATISNLNYVNYTVEDAQMGGANGGYLIEMMVSYDINWSTSVKERGQTKDVLIDNIVVLGGKDVSGSISGYGPNNKTSNVKISNLKIKGQEIRSLADAKIATNPNTTEDIEVSYTKDATGANLTATIMHATTKEAEVKINETAKQGDSYIVPAFAILIPKEVNMGANRSVTATASSNSEQAALIADGDRNTAWVSATEPKTGNYEYLYIECETEFKLKYVKVRLPENAPSQEIEFNIFGSNDNENWTLIQTSQKYKFDPTSGNLQQFAVSPSGEFKYYRFRFSGSTRGEVAIGEIELYAANLALGKNVICSNYVDVYETKNCTDGNTQTYWEGERGLFPNEFYIDLEREYTVTSAVYYFPLSNAWEERYLDIEVQGSLDGENWTTLIVRTTYFFSVETGHVNEMFVESPTPIRYIKFIGYNNTAWNAFQCGEVNVYDNVINK